MGLKLLLNKNFHGLNLTVRSPSSASGLNQLIAGVNIGPSSLVQIGLRSQLTDKEDKSVWRRNLPHTLHILLSLSINIASLNTSLLPGSSPFKFI